MIPGVNPSGETTPLGAARSRASGGAPREAALAGDRVAGRLPTRYLALVELAERTRSPQTLWWGGRSLSEARNAHSTNTREAFQEALEHGYNFLEGDVRAEINHKGRLEMRHDKIHESGDNLTLREWLELGKASGRGLKLDVKESDHMPQIMALIAEVGVPQERLMINLGYGAMARWGEEIRKQFPGATLAINPPAGEGPLQADQVDKMIAQAKQFGSPVHFVVRYDLLGDDAIARFKGHGPISVWNSPFEGKPVKDPAAVARDLGARGVDGVIDIRKSHGWRGKLRAWLDYGGNGLRTFGNRAPAKVAGFFKSGADLARSAWKKIF